MNQRKSGVILSYIALILNALIGFAYVPLLLSLMGDGEYGLYQLMGSFVAYLSIMDFGMSSTVIRYYSRYRSLDDRKNAENSLGMAAVIYTVITVLVLAVGAYIYFRLDGWYSQSLSGSELQSAKWIFLVLLVNIAVSIPTKIYDAVVISHERFVFLKGATIIQTLLTPVAVVLVLLKFPYALAFVVVQTIFNLLLVGAKVVYCLGRIKVRIRLHKFSGKLFGEMMSFSFFVFLGAITDQLFWRTNLVILGGISTVVVAVYGVAMTIFNAYMSLSTVITGVFLPRVTTLVAQDASSRELSELFVRIGRLQYLLLSCVLSGFAVFGRQFVSIWAGEGYEDVYLITLLLIVPFTVDLIQNIGNTILQATNKLAFRSVSFFVTALVNIALAYPMAHAYGAIGCAIPTGVTFLLMNAVLNVYYARGVHLDVGAFWKQIGRMTLPCLLAMACGVGINLIGLGGGLVELAVKIALYCGVFAGWMWLLGMNAYEKDLVRGLCRKILRR